MITGHSRIVGITLIGHALFFASHAHAKENVFSRWIRPRSPTPVSTSSRPVTPKTENRSPHSIDAHPIASAEIVEDDTLSWKEPPPTPKLPNSFPRRPPIEPPLIPLGPSQTQPLPNSSTHPGMRAESGNIPYVQEETPDLNPPWQSSSKDTTGTPPLQLDTVVDAVNEFFPLLLAVEQERLLADGEIVSAIGAFDLRLRAEGTSNALGFYQYNRGFVGVEQQLGASGAKLFAGHRIGVGNFPVWYGNLETYQGGEFMTGAKIPILRDRKIDKYRATLAKAAIDRQIAEPNILKSRIEFIRAASFAYWDWLAAGQSYLVGRSLLSLAETRDEALRKRIDAGITKPIERTDNQRVIVQRRAKLVAAQQKLQQAAIKLSLFFRDSNGIAILPSADRLPLSFPNAEPAEMRRIPNEVAYALARRPEILKLNLLREKNGIDMAVARNEFLPSLDAQIYGSQDVGGPNPKKDKGEYQLEAGLVFEVPLQRRYARGQIEIAEANRSQINLEQRYAQDKVVTDLQNAISAMDGAFLQVGQAREAIELARIMEEAERRNLFLGNSNILFVNLRETATVDAAILEIDALAEYFRAVAEYRAALAVDANDIL